MRCVTFSDDQLLGSEAGTGERREVARSRVARFKLAGVREIGDLASRSQLNDCRHDLPTLMPTEELLEDAKAGA